MQLLLFLILFPLITALFMLAVRRDSDRNWIVKLSALAIGAVTVILLVTQFDKGTLYYGFNAEPVNLLMFVLEMVITVIILGFAIKFRNYLVIALTLVETALIIWFESAATPAVAVKSPLFIDQFSIVMALIVGIIGSLICVYRSVTCGISTSTIPGFPTGPIPSLFLCSSSSPRCSVWSFPIASSGSSSSGK